MKLRKCEFCGTEFDAALGQCPLCGKAVQPGAAEPQPVMPAAYKPAGGHGGKFSKKKGGRFAQHCAPARVVSILLSDVLGDRPDVIGSGPAVPDPSTSGEALEAAAQAGLLPDAALEALLRQETPKLLENARWHVVGGVRLLCAAAEETCRRLGYAPFVLTDRLSC